MLSPEDIVRLYENVLRRDTWHHSIPQTEIKNAIQNMAEAYKPYNTNWIRQEGGFVADYNDPAHRYGYLHKYAPLHTCLVQDMFHKALTESDDLKDILLSKFDDFNICSLGGGPGADIIGIISACQPLGLVTCSAEVVDLMSGWKSTFNSIVGELQHGSYGTLSLNLNAEYFNCSYTATNLLHGIDSRVLDSIRSADLITMVKFISAATCRDTECMVKTIFNTMKDDALVLFIDNAAGGFSQMISRLAEECDLITIFGPLNHFQYSKSIFSVMRYGYVSCFETRVTVHILKKFSPLHCQGLSSPSQHLISEASNNTYSEEAIIDLGKNASSYEEKSHLEFPAKIGKFIIFIFIVVVFVIVYLCYK